MRNVSHNFEDWKNVIYNRVNCFLLRIRFDEYLFPTRNNTEWLWFVKYFLFEKGSELSLRLHILEMQRNIECRNSIFISATRLENSREKKAGKLLDGNTGRTLTSKIKSDRDMILLNRFACVIKYFGSSNIN